MNFREVKDYMGKQVEVTLQDGHKVRGLMRDSNYVTVKIAKRWFQVAQITKIERIDKPPGA